MKTPFTTNIIGQEVFRPEFVKCSPVELAINLLGLSLTFGIERVEDAIKATFPPASSTEIIIMMSVALRLQQSFGSA